MTGSIGGRVVVIGDIHALMGRRDELADLLVRTQAAARREPGCVAYAFGDVLGEPGHIVVVQEWRDPAALEDHYRSDAFTTYQQEVGPLLSRPSEIRIHDVQQTVRPERSAPMDPRQAD
jgi:quinol monooxygenase YgiN